MRNEGPYGGFFRAVRRIARLFCTTRESCIAPLPEPCVLVCRHKNGSGPLRTLVLMREQARPWVLDVFCQRESCRRHFRVFTLPKRLGWPKWLCAPAAWVIGWVVPPVMRSTGCIPVSRGSARALTALRRTLDAVEAGQRVIIYPDIDYADTSSEVRALYEGYLLLAPMYERRAGKKLAFVPMAAGRGIITVGESLYMGAGESLGELNQRVRRALSELEIRE